MDVLALTRDSPELSSTLFLTTLRDVDLVGNGDGLVGLRVQEGVDHLHGVLLLLYLDPLALNLQTLLCGSKLERELLVGHTKLLRLQLLGRSKGSDLRCLSLRSKSRLAG